MEMVDSTPNPTLSYGELSSALDSTSTPPSYLTGGCLCGKVRYRAEMGKKYTWPPGPHTCSCTHCRKHSGAPFALFLTFTCPQLGWLGPEMDTPTNTKTSVNEAQTPSKPVAEPVYDVPDMFPWQPKDMPIMEYSHTQGRYRGFCGTCGSIMYWRCPNEDGNEIEMGVGTVDEELLEKYGRELCTPRRGRFYAGKEIHGLGFGGEFKGGVGCWRFKEGSRSEKLE